jgi:hypothetical protein
MATNKIPVKEVVFDEQTSQHLSKPDRLYASSQIKFALCSLATRDNKSEQLTNFHHCRDGFLQRIMNHFNGSAALGMVSTAKTIVMLRTISGKKPTETVPFWYKGSHAEWMLSSVKAGVKLVNHFEKENRWKTSKIYKVKVPKDSSSHIYMIEGSRWWMTSTHTLSLFILLLRFGTREEIHKLGNIRKTESIIALISSFTSGVGCGLCKNVWKWPLLLSNRKSLFKGRTFEDNYKKCSSGFEGVYQITTGAIKDKGLQKRFAEICKIHAPKIKNK